MTPNYMLLIIIKQCYILRSVPFSAIKRSFLLQLMEVNMETNSQTLFMEGERESP